MALEWIVLGAATAAEAAMVLLLTIPVPIHLRAGLSSIARASLKPFLTVIPFSVFLLLDIYWKYETRARCDVAGSCTPTELLRHQKSMMKSERNGLLVATALIFYWLLFSVSRLVVQVDLLNQKIDKMKDE